MNSDEIPQYYKLAVYLKVPLELRMERVKQREYDINSEIAFVRAAICMNND